MWAHLVTLKYAPQIEKFYGTSAVYVFWSSVRFVLDSLYKKGKAVPLQAWSGPEVSRKLR
jgi:hypothetical protein